MKSNSNSKAKLAVVLLFVVVFALGISALCVNVIYESVMKPTDFVFEDVASGDGTGYYRHNFNELSDDEKKVYSVILKEIYNMPEKIEIPELGNGDLNRIFSALSLDNPDLFCLGLNCSVYTEGYKTYFEPVYSMTKAEYDSRLSQAKEIINTIINGANSYTSVYEKELYVHDYIINNCIYSDIAQSPLGNTIYGCLVEGKASCEGYSRSFQYVMNMLNIDNRLMTGDSAEDGVNYVGHMWNYIVLEGQGYFVDITWDDPKSETSVLRHTYFNVDTDDILLEHRVEQSVPLTTANKFNYFVYENAFFENGAGEEFETTVSNAVHTAIQRGYQCVELRFSDASVMEQARNSLFNEGVIYNVYKDAGVLQDLTGAKVYYSSDEGLNVICLFF